jgi:hypothetical protein
MFVYHLYYITYMYTQFIATLSNVVLLDHNSFNLHLDFLKKTTLVWLMKSIVLVCLILSLCAARANAMSWIRRNGTRLHEDGGPFAMVGCNIYWLGLDENVPPSTVAYPTRFRIREALETARQLGATIVRSHTLGISTGNVRSFESELNTFSFSEPIEVIDYAVHVARELGLRLVVPLTDNWNYYHGGKANFVQWHGMNDSLLFYSDVSVIRSFKVYVAQLLNHRSAYSGRRLADEPAVLAFESGNELVGAPASWTREIAQFVKRLAPNQLFMDGEAPVDGRWSHGALQIDEVDIYTSHYYPMSVEKLNRDADTIERGAGRVFFAGEYGWSKGSIDDLASFLAALERPEGGINNAWWSLFPHGDGYGFVQHNDGFTMHWPGDDADMAERAQMLRNSALRIRGIAANYSVAPAPLITEALCNAASSSVTLAWRGAMGASTYSVEGAHATLESSANATTLDDWQPMCTQCADDNQTPLTLSNAANFNAFRVRAFNLDNAPSPYSSVQLCNMTLAAKPFYA